MTTHDNLAAITNTVKGTYFLFHFYAVFKLTDSRNNPTIVFDLLRAFTATFISVRLFEFMTNQDTGRRLPPYYALALRCAVADSRRSGVGASLIECAALRQVWTAVEARAPDVLIWDHHRLRMCRSEFDLRPFRRWRSRRCFWARAVVGRSNAAGGNSLFVLGYLQPVAL